MKTKVLNLIFALCILLFLLASLGKAVLRPKSMNLYENRYMERIAGLSVSSWLDGSFQGNMETGLNDQVPGAQTLKKLYHSTFSLYQKLIALPLAERLADRYVHFGSTMHFGQHLCSYLPDLAEEQDALDRRIKSYNSIVAAHPDKEFYLYYIESDTDLDFEAGERSVQVFEYLRDKVILPEENMGRFRVDNYTDYSPYYYKTDHHWNYAGSYEGYREMLAMLAPEETPLEPLEKRYVGRFSGSKASGRELVTFSEPFYAYRFSFPEMSVELERMPAEDYGQQEAFFAGEAYDLSYGAFYGNDNSLVILRTEGNEGKENILLLGDSFDNAVVKLLASHFNTTYAVDLRWYEAYAGEKFRLGEYLEENHISKVMFCGKRSYFTHDDFLPED